MAANPSIQLGTDGNWAIKEDNLLAYKKDGTRFFNKEFDFTRATFATRVNKSGLIEKGRENLIKQSNAFNTSPWVNADGASVISGQTGYDGSNNAWKLNSGYGNFSRVQQLLSQSGVQTFSVYAKAGEVDHLRILAITGTNPDFRFDLTNGTITSETGTDIISGKITFVDNGWYRCEMSFNATASSYRFYPMSDSNTFAPDGDGIYIQDSQLEQGLVATDYIESGATNGKAGVLENLPRIDYKDGANSPSLLLEPQRTNIIIQSEYFGGSEWQIFDNATIEDNFGTSPEGVQNAAKIGSGGGSNDFIYEIQPVTIGTTYTTSCFVKNIDSTRTGVYGVNKIDVNIIWNGAEIDYVTGTNVDYQDYGNGWYRVWQTSTATETSSIMRFYSHGEGTRDKSVLLYGYQIEIGSYATSYIPTFGSTATRNADVCNNSGSAQDFNDSEGVLYAEISSLADGENRQLGISDGTSTNRLLIALRPDNETIRLYFQGTSGSLQLDSSGHDFSSFIKIAAKYKSGDFALWINGVEEQISTSTVTTSGLNRLDLYNIAAPSQISYGNVKTIAVFKRAMSDGELYLLTVTQYQSYQEMATALNYTL